ncbi:MAG: penicillin-binding protein [Gemmatimonadetes bacterium]|nr:penicillin-binding protein [Gemmatimonadota bacterium]
MQVEDRTRAAAWVGLVCGIGLVARLFWLQVFAAEELRAAGRGQSKITVTLEAPRGSIYDRDLRPMAHTVGGASPKKDRGGSVISSRGGRVYVGREASAHVVGFVGSDGGGLEGVELSRDEALTGVKGRAVLGRFADRRTIELERRDPVGGGHVVLSLDLELQEAAHNALRAGVEKERAESGSAVVLDPISGEVLAMANWPSYDPGALGRSPIDSRRNRAITDLLEPGSVFKVVPFAAAIDEDLVPGGARIDCGNGKIRIAGRTIRDVHPYESLPFEEVLVQSSNVGTIHVAEIVGPERLYRYSKGFGFGEPTGIDLPGEGRGKLNAPGDDLWSGLSLACLAIGQEVTVTTVQMACAMGVLASGGILVEPHAVLRMLGPHGEVHAVSLRRPVRRVVKPETAARMTRILTRVVEEGTGTNAAIEGVRVAGKTGTAQRAHPEGGYEGGGYNSTFAGYLPDRSPPLVIAVAVIDPREEHYGGTVAAPIFREIAELIVRRDAVRGPRIAPGSALARVRVPSLGGKSIDQARNELERIGLRTRVEGEAGRVSQQEPRPGTALTRGASVLLLAAPSQRDDTMAVEVPELTGLSIRGAHRALLDLGLGLRLDGNGHVIGQLPRAGQRVAPGTVCSVRAEPRSGGAS